MSQDLIESLQRSNRRWKMLAATGWGAFGLALLAGVVFLFTLARASMARLEEARAQAVFELQKARKQLQNEGHKAVMPRADDGGARTSP